jgi:hypothetical protein
VEGAAGLHDGAIQVGLAALLGLHQREPDGDRRAVLAAEALRQVGEDAVAAQALDHQRVLAWIGVVGGGILRDGVGDAVVPEHPDRRQVAIDHLPVQPRAEQRRRAVLVEQAVAPLGGVQHGPTALETIPEVVQRPEHPRDLVAARRFATPREVLPVDAMDGRLDATQPRRHEPVQAERRRQPGQGEGGNQPRAEGEGAALGGHDQQRDSGQAPITAMSQTATASGTGDRRTVDFRTMPSLRMTRVATPP